MESMAREKQTAITVVMAVYNGEKYLAEQLDSIAAQTRPVDTILLRDDGSGDGSRSLIHQWIEDHPECPFEIRLIEGKKNLGYIGNFRALIEQAPGDLIFLCDQDDRWHSDKVETMAACMEEHPEVLALASSFCFMNSQSRNYSVALREGWSNNNLIPWNVEHPGGLNEITLDRMLEHNYFQGAAMVIRKELARQWLSLPASPLAHDWHLALLASLKNGLFYLDRPLFDYRIHEANVTGLPQAKGRSKIRTLKTWMNGYYRRVVVEDMVRVLETLKNDAPEAFDASCQARLDYCHRYLDALHAKTLGSYLKLKNHPGRALCMSGKEYAVGAAYIVLSHFAKLPDQKV